MRKKIQDVADAHKKLSILIVDDDEQICSYMCQILEKEGFHVYVTGDGFRGIELYRQHSPALIITDLVMPNMEGVEFIIELRRNNVTVPIIAMSGGNAGLGDDFLLIADKLGADITLPKPFSNETLIDSVNELLGDKSNKHEERKDI
jgi:DNA-binding response OmpR family regulator